MSKSYVDGYPGRGCKVKFLGKNGYEKELKEALTELTIDKVYTIDDTSVGSYLSTYHFYNDKNEYKSYNTAMFREVEIDPTIINYYEVYLADAALNYNNECTLLASFSTEELAKEYQDKWLKSNAYIKKTYIEEKFLTILNEVPNVK